MTSQQMSLTEARELLGLEATADAPPPDALTLRKAYVRAIKRYSPESNPLEFQRVRAAFEFLDERRRWAEYDDDDDASSDAASEAEVPKEPRAELDGPDAHEDAPRPAYDGPPLPPWHTTLDDLTAILTDAGVMQDRVRPRAPISEASGQQLTSLIWLGWPETLDQPLIRFAARLFELGHTYGGHLLLERLLAAAEHPPVARGAFHDTFRPHLVEISREVRENGERALLGWVFGPEDVEVTREQQRDPTPVGRNTKPLVIGLFCILVGVATQLNKKPEDARSPPRAPDSAWAEQSCRDFQSVCRDIRALDRIVVSRQCDRVVAELTAFRATIGLSLGVPDTNALMARARRQAGVYCYSEVNSKPPPPPLSPP